MASPLRILHTVVNMNRGGAETMLMNLYRHIDRSQIQFDFLTSKEGVFDEEIRSLGGVIHRIPHITEVGHNGYKQALNQFFHDHATAYTIIHSHMDKMSGFVLRSARKAGIPVRVAHSHNTRSEGGVAARIYKWYAGTHIRTAATHYAACSSAAARWLFSGREKLAMIMHNGISCGQFAFSIEVRMKLRKELHISEDCLVVGHVGRFAPQKNHTQLIDIFYKLQKQNDNSMLLLVGDGQRRHAIEQKVKDLKLEDKVRFLGIRENIDQLLQAFDVFVFPSHHEGLPVTLIEAQGAGLPCIISDHITPEVDMGQGLVHFFSLNKEDRCLTQIHAVARKSSRVIPSNALALKGYDIKQTALQASEFYLSHFEVTNENTYRVHAHV